MRTFLLAFVWLLVAAAFTIPFLALSETHQMFVDGQEAVAEVVKVKVSKKDELWVRLSYQADGETHTTSSEFVDDEDRRLKVGDQVPILIHQRSPFRATIKRSVDAGRPSSLLLLGAAVSLLLMIYTLMLPKLRARRRAARTSGLDVIVDSLRRTRTLSLSVGVGVVAFGGFCGWMGIMQVDKTASQGVNIAITIFGGFCVLLGLLLLRPGLRLMPIKRSAILQKITGQPQEIAWLYEHVAQNASLGEASAMHDVQVWFTDGKAYSISVVAEDAKLLLEELARRAPHAPVGYDQETERLYKEDPTRFRPG